MYATDGLLAVFLAGAFLLAGTLRASQPAATTQPATQPVPGKGVVLRFWGHACFTITAPDGKVLLIDPFSPAKVGYHAFDARPDVVLISHEHFDHADTSWLKGTPEVIHGLAEDGSVRSIDERAGPFQIRTVAARHWTDPAQKGRGNVAIFVIEVAGLRIVHLSDLGQKLEPRQVEAIGRPDVLLVPVGGFYTIDADQAYAVVEQCRPRAYVVPMHFRTTSLAATLRSQLAEPQGFLRHFGPRVLRPDGNELTVDPANLPAEPHAVLLNYLPAPGAATTQ